MAAERLLRGFWPFATVLMAVLAALMFGLQDVLPLEAFWAGSVAAVLALLVTLALGLRRFRWPSVQEALDRLDRTLPGRPIAAITDTQAIGARDDASRAVWAAHVQRMTARVRQARAVEPDLKIAARDPFALRYVALVALVMAFMFGSVWRVASVTEMTPGGAAAAETAAWEGWVEPPAHTGKPSLYLADIPPGALTVPQGSRLTIRLYGEVGRLIVDETVSGRTAVVEGASDPSQSFEIVQGGTLAIRGPGGAEWQVTVTQDQPPEIRPEGEATRTVAGEMRQEFWAKDDYGVTGARARIELDLDAVDRRYGLTIDPEPREPIEIDLPLSVTGDRSEFTETITENFAEHPWAHLPVVITLTATDAAGQEGSSDPAQVVLPGRRFFDTMALAIVEMRRDLLWSAENGRRTAQVLRAVSWQPDEAFRQPGVYLKLRTVIRRLEDALAAEAGLTPEFRDEMAEVLWAIALEIEDGNLADALERLRRAQERLAEAIRNGATDEEIAELMQELREAMDQYMQQLAQNSPPAEDQADNQNTQTITGDQLEQMLQRLQELMEQGRTAEAQELLQQLQQMMENMQVARGQGQPSPGQEAMEGLADTLRQQQELSDDTFGDLQEQFNPGQQQPGQQGQQGQQGEGQQGEGQQGQQGQGQQGQGRPGQGQPGQGQQGQDGRSLGQMLADRQQQLRDLLNQQRNGMPGQGTPEGDAARDALGRAEGAMDNAEEALRQGDLPGALDDQAEAMEALREGMRNLGEMMAQQQQQGQGQQGDAIGQADRNGRRDPLGRDEGANGRIGTDERMLQGEDVYRRARELLDEIRRRSSDQERPEVERDYLRRLLDRF